MGSVEPLDKAFLSGRCGGQIWGVIPRHNKSRRNGEGKSRPDTLPTERRIAVKGHLMRTPIRLQKTDDCLYRCLLVEVFSSLRPQSNRGPSIDKITYFNNMLAFPDACSALGKYSPHP